MKTEEKFVEFYFQRRNEGMDFSEIRRELKRKRIPEDQIKEIIREIDFKLIAAVNVNEDKVNKKGAVYLGFFLIVFGSLLTIATFFGWINMGDKFIFAYGPILGGLTLIAATKRTKSNHFNRRTGFRK